ncbi:integrase, catalytic region, zinc finger, CCHC-type containing protein [Tanacetum coccineum]
MLNEIESLKAQLRSKESCFTSDYVKPKVLAPGMYAIDVKPIPHPLKNNRSAHLNYISHLKESVEIVREIVEEARVSNDSTDASGSKPRKHTKKQWILPAKKENKKEVEVHLRTNNKIWKPKGRLSDNSLYKTKRVWKATGKLFTDIGYQWRPTGKKLALGKLDCGYQWRPTGKKFALGEMCHLTKLSVKFQSGQSDSEDHLGAIMVMEIMFQGDSVILKSILRGGTWTILFSVGQFCDSDLKLPFRKHYFFVLFQSNHGCGIVFKPFKLRHDNDLCSKRCLFLNPSHGSCVVQESSENKGKKYILVIDRWTFKIHMGKFLRSKDENSSDCHQLSLSKTQVASTKVRFIQHRYGTEFVNQVMSEYYEGVDVFHQKSVPRTPQQNGVVKDVSIHWWKQQSLQ